MKRVEEKHYINPKSIYFSVADVERSALASHGWSLIFFNMPKENKSYYFAQGCGKKLRVIIKCLLLILPYILQISRSYKEAATQGHSADHPY